MAGPRASITVHDGLAFALGMMGHLYCLNATNGDLHWKRDLNIEYNIQMLVWSIASAPLIENDLLIVQVGRSPGACIVAFDRKTGEERWKALDDRASYAAPIVIDQAGKRVLVCWTGDNVVGLNPQSGELYWVHPFPPKGVILAVATQVLYKNRLFMACFFEGSLMLKVDSERLAIEEMWWRRGADEKNTDGIHPIILIPIILKDYIYGVDSYGELRCLDARTGEHIWKDLSAVPKAHWSTIHFIKNAERVWMFNEQGELLITSLSSDGLNIISRAQLIEPTCDQMNQRGGVCWTHPAGRNQFVLFFSNCS